MNQAIRMAEPEYVARTEWFEVISDKAAQKEWIDKYFVPYLNNVKTDYNYNGRYFYTIYFVDGSAVSASFKW